jgi:hypothetical protein
MGVSSLEDEVGKVRDDPRERAPEMSPHRNRVQFVVAV